MKRFSFRLITVLLTFFIGITVTTFWMFYNYLPKIEVSVSQLIADFQENADKANKKYQGKTLIFTATVTNYIEASEGFIGVSLENGRVHCIMNKFTEPDVLSKL